MSFLYLYYLPLPIFPRGYSHQSDSSIPRATNVNCSLSISLVGVMTSLSKLELSLKDTKNSLEEINSQLDRITGREDKHRQVQNYIPENPLPGKLVGADGWIRYKRGRDEVFKPNDTANEKRIKRTILPKNKQQRLNDSEILKVSEKPQKPSTDDDVTIQRNIRMFGNIMSTLKKFQMTEVQNSTSNKEQRRREIAHKLEREEQQERDGAANQKRELISSKQDAQQQIVCFEEKIEIEKLNTFLDTHSDNLSHFIKSKAKPHIFYLPKKHNKATEDLLSATKSKLNSHKQMRRNKLDYALSSKYSSKGVKVSSNKANLKSSDKS